MIWNVFSIISCEQGDRCLNSIEIAGDQSGKCGVCRFSPNGLPGMTKFWKSEKKGEKHPAEVTEKKQKKLDKFNEACKRRKTVNVGRQKVLKQAARAEKQTERNIIHATRNSGRSNKDGDHVVGGIITLDTKHQSKRDNPVVLLSELMKVREDAVRANKLVGGLVLRNKHGVGVVVFYEKDFGVILGHLVKE